MRCILICFFLLWLDATSSNQRGKHRHMQHLLLKLADTTINATIAPSVTSWNTIDTPKRIAVTSMSVDHHSDGSWHVPSMHERNSAGWNRTFNKASLLRPYACNIRFYALALESTLQGFMGGGTGYLGVEVKHTSLNVGSRQTKREMSWYGYDKNETQRLHCYYMTSKGYGSEFIDSPKTLGIAIYCPVPLDAEVGEFAFRKVMEPGFFCRSIADDVAKLEINLRPSSFVVPPDDFPEVLSDTNEIKGELVTTPSAARMQDIKTISQHDYRPHAVCTVQTFRNHQTGPMLFLFVMYYQRMGWRVIVYDRFGLHREFMESLVALPGVDYHPYTMFQLANPTKYNMDYASKMGTDRKFFYQMEKNWGYSGTKADTADQDQDKTRTYDHARVEYSHLDMVFYIDADEFFFCPQASESIAQQRQYQQQQMGLFASQGIEEMRFVRIPYSGMAPVNFDNTQEKRDATDFTNHTQNCMIEGYAALSEAKMFACWSSLSAYDNFPKSADFAGVCPFHYNHWSCDGMRNGGRDYGNNIPRCRCKVAFDMINGFEYKPMLKRCHLMHFNDNKFRFQGDYNNARENVFRALLLAVSPIFVSHDDSFSSLLLPLFFLFYSKARKAQK